MLTAFKEQLKQLAKNEADELMKQIHISIEPEKRTEHGESLKNFIVVMPDMIKQIQLWSKDPRIPSQEKKLHGFMLTYLYHPIDFLPDSGKGLFGYLDDAYFIGSIYSRTNTLIAENPKIKNQSIPELSTVNKWLEITRKVIPRESQKIDRLLGELINGRLDSFDQLMTQEEATL